VSTNPIERYADLLNLLFMDHFSKLERAQLKSDQFTREEKWIIKATKVVLLSPATPAKGCENYENFFLEFTFP
jgi:hypothetical protein